MEQENDCMSWTFPVLFQSLESKVKFSQDLLNAFEQFPSETCLNCDDFYSLISLVCSDVPYNFIVFVCECVDPSISSGTIMSHRIPFGNFLLALPCCIIFPYFMHELLTLFKTADTLRKGVIKRDKFVEILHQIFERFLPPQRNPKDKSDTPLPLPLCKEVEMSNGYEKRYPRATIVEEFENATEDLGMSSVQTLLFVMWQKNLILMQCKDRTTVPDVSEFIPEGSQHQYDNDDAQSSYSEQTYPSNVVSSRIEHPGSPHEDLPYVADGAMQLDNGEHDATPATPNSIRRQEEEEENHENESENKGEEPKQEDDAQH